MNSGNAIINDNEGSFFYFQYSVSPIL